jgi:hypothetical protein
MYEHTIVTIIKILEEDVRMFCITLKGDVLVAIDFEMVNDINVAIEITNAFFMVRFNSLFKSNMIAPYVFAVIKIPDE